MYNDKSKSFEIGYKEKFILRIKLTTLLIF